MPSCRPGPQNDNLASAVEAFSESHALSPHQTQALLTAARAQAVEAGALPMAEYSYTAADGRALQLPIYAGASVRSAVSALAAAQGLDTSEADAIYEDVTKQLVAKRLAPALTLTVPLAAGGEAPLTVLIEETVPDALERFAARYGAPSEGPAALTARVTRALIDARLLPILEAVVGVGGGGAELPIRMFAGESPEAVAAAFVSQHGLHPEGEGEGEGNGEASSSSSIKDEKAALVTQLAQHLRRRLVASRAVPVSEVPVTVDGTPKVLPFYEGDTIGAVVDAFALKEGIPEASRPDLLAAVHRQLASDRIIPLITINATVQGTPLTLVVFEGDQPRDVAEKVLASAGLDVEAEAPTLAAAIRDELVAAQLAPVAQLDLFVEGVPAPLPVFVGDRLASAVERFRAAHALPEDTAPQLEKLIGGKLQALRLLPLAEVPISLNGGADTASLPFFAGDVLTEKVDAFAAKHGLTEASTRELHQALQARLQADRLLPLLTLPISQGATTGTDAESEKVVIGELRVFEGETILQASEAFRAAHGLPEGVIPDLVALVHKAAVDKGLAMVPATAPVGEAPTQL